MTPSDGQSCSLGVLGTHLGPTVSSVASSNSATRNSPRAPVGARSPRSRDPRSVRRQPQAHREDAALGLLGPLASYSTYCRSCPRGLGCPQCPVDLDEIAVFEVTNPQADVAVRLERCAGRRPRHSDAKKTAQQPAPAARSSGSGRLQPAAYAARPPVRAWATNNVPGRATAAAPPGCQPRSIARRWPAGAR